MCNESVAGLLEFYLFTHLVHTFFAVFVDIIRFFMRPDVCVCACVWFMCLLRVL